MRYELYIDVLFFVNFTMNLILLRLLAGIAKRRAGWGRLLAGAAAGAAGACAAVCRGWYMAGFLALPAVMVRIAFRPGDIREFLKETLCFLFAAVFLGGAMEFLYEHTRFGVFLELALRQDAPGLRLLGWGFLAGGGVFLFRALWTTAEETGKEREALCQVTLRTGVNTVSVTAYRDTGNCLTEPESGQPVSVVTAEVWRRLLTEADDGRQIRRIPFRTVANPLGVMEAAQIDAMEICGETKRKAGCKAFAAEGKAKAAAPGRQTVCRPWIARAPFAVSADGSYEMLLHRDL